MTDKEISKLTRKELIEMLLAATEENQKLTEEVEKLNRELRVRRIAIESSGTMAEAALKLNRVFEAADAAAKQYLQNVKAKADAEKKAEEDAAQIAEEVEAAVEELIADAEAKPEAEAEPEEKAEAEPEAKEEEKEA